MQRGGRKGRGAGWVSRFRAIPPSPRVRVPLIVLGKALCSFLQPTSNPEIYKSNHFYSIHFSDEETSHLRVLSCQRFLWVSELMHEWELAHGSPNFCMPPFSVSCFDCLATVFWKRPCLEDLEKTEKTSQKSHSKIVHILFLLMATSVTQSHSIFWSCGAHSQETVWSSPTFTSRMWEPKPKLG